MRAHRIPGLLAATASEQALEVLRAGVAPLRPPGSCRSAIGPSRGGNASASISNASTAAAFAAPERVDHGPVEVPVRRVGRRERREVVHADEAPRAPLGELEVQPMRPVQRSPLLERARQPTPSRSGSGNAASGRCGERRNRRRPRPSSSTARSRPVSEFSARCSDPGTCRSVRKLATWPSAWTPASVRPATVSLVGSPSTRSSAASSSPWTVRFPGCTAQPLKRRPSYAMSSR